MTQRVRVDLGRISSRCREYSSRFLRHFFLLEKRNFGFDLRGDGPECGNAIAVHEKIDKIAFTGSVEVRRETFSHDSSFKQ